MSEQPMQWTESEYQGVRYRTAEQPMPGRSDKAHKRNPLWAGYVEVWNGSEWVGEHMQANQSPRGYAYGASQWTGIRPNEAACKAARWLELQVRIGRIQPPPAPAAVTVAEPEDADFIHYNPGTPHTCVPALTVFGDRWVCQYNWCARSLGYAA